ncbi:MAG: DUF3387 domain-containing protein, partial [Acidimicrobiales bacterium]|nr:DUF3387 domain-containing protein [Acidimicrobiales bacterium]
RSIATKLASANEAPDIDDVMDSVNQLLDRSVGTQEYVIRAGGQADPLIDLNQLDFEQLALRFAGNKRTAAKQAEKDLDQRLKQAARKNPTRVDLAERFRKLIDEYNAGTHNLEELLRRLKAISDELTADEQRTVREDLTEAELAIYDLLTKPEPELSPAEQQKVKAAARSLLDHVTEKLVLDWRKRQHTRAAVHVAVGKILDEQLPEVYGPSLFDEKVQQVYEHIYGSYFDDGASVYDEAPASTPPAAPVSTMPSATSEVTEELLAQAKADPVVLAALMEELFGTTEIWFKPTEALLGGEIKHVEYKQSARWSEDDPNEPNKLAEQIIAKTVAGFLNAEGGTLLIGVHDNGTPVGLDDDYRRVQPADADGFVNWLDSMLQNALGHAGAHRVQIRIDVIDGLDVCRVDVPASHKPIYCTFKRKASVLFQRRNNSTREVPVDELDGFLAERFPQDR